VTALFFLGGRKKTRAGGKNASLPIFGGRRAGRRAAVREKHEGRARGKDKRESACRYSRRRTEEKYHWRTQLKKGGRASRRLRGTPQARRKCRPWLLSAAAVRGAAQLPAARRDLGGPEESRQPPPRRPPAAGIWEDRRRATTRRSPHAGLRRSPSSLPVSLPTGQLHACSRRPLPSPPGSCSRR